MDNATPTSGSLRRRLVVTLIGGAAVLAMVLFFAVRNFATQVAQQGQDNILSASAASILDAASITDGEVEIDIPYSAFSMLSTPSDDRVFYAINQDGAFLSGYEDLGAEGAAAVAADGVATAQIRGDLVRIVAASRTLIGEARPIEMQVLIAQTQEGLSETLARISRNAALLGLGFFVLAAALSFWATSATIGQLNRLTSSVTRRGPQGQ